MRNHVSDSDEIYLWKVDNKMSDPVSEEIYKTLLEQRKACIDAFELNVELIKDEIENKIAKAKEDLLKEKEYKINQKIDLLEDHIAQIDAKLVELNKPLPTKQKYLTTYGWIAYE